LASENKKRWVIFIIFLIAATLGVSALTDFTVHPPELYFINSSGNVTTVFTDGSELYVNNSLVCTVDNGLCGGGDAGGWNATNTTTSTDLHVNITSGNLANGGLYLCGNPINTSIGGFITVNKTYYETNCNGCNEHKRLPQRIRHRASHHQPPRHDPRRERRRTPRKEPASKHSPRPRRHQSR